MFVHECGYNMVQVVDSTVLTQPLTNPKISIFLTPRWYAHCLPLLFLYLSLLWLVALVSVAAVVSVFALSVYIFALLMLSTDLLLMYP